MILQAAIDNYVYVHTHTHMYYASYMDLHFNRQTSKRNKSAIYVCICYANKLKIEQKSELRVPHEIQANNRRAKKA